MEVVSGIVVIVFHCFFSNTYTLLCAHKEEEHVTSGARVPGGNLSVCLNLE